jgi:hypothetical protein
MSDEESVEIEFTESAVLNRLCEAGPLKIEELERELGSDAEACVNELDRRGLIHRLGDGFLIPSAAGRHANHLDPTW